MLNSGEAWWKQSRDGWNWNVIVCFSECGYEWVGAGRWLYWGLILCPLAWKPQGMASCMHPHEYSMFSPVRDHASIETDSRSLELEWDIYCPQKTKTSGGKSFWLARASGIPADSGIARGGARCRVCGPHQVTHTVHVHVCKLWKSWWFWITPSYYISFSA